MEPIGDRTIVVFLDKDHFGGCDGLVLLDEGVEDWLYRLANSLNKVPRRCVLLNDPPLEITDAISIPSKRIELLEKAAQVQLLQPFRVAPEFDERLIFLGGVQSNLPTLWSSFEIVTSAGTVPLDIAQVALLDHIGFERVLVFRKGADGRLLASIGVGEWSREINLTPGDSQFSTRFYLKEISYDGLGATVWHTSVMPTNLFDNADALERSLFDEQGIFSHASSDDFEIFTEELKLETAWVCAAIFKLVSKKDIRFVVARVREASSLERLTTQCPGPWTIAVVDSENVWWSGGQSV